jgi:hypothetical protein
MQKLANKLCDAQHPEDPIRGGQRSSIRLSGAWAPRGTMDDWDPAVIDAIAAGASVILFDNAGVGLSTGATLGTVRGMADKAGIVPKRSAGLCCFRLAGYALFFHGSLAGLSAFAPRSFPISARATGANTMHAVGCLGAAIGSSLMGAVML